MSKPRSQRGRSQRAPLGMMLSGGFTVDPEALQKMGPEGLDSLIQFMKNAEPDDGSTQSTTEHRT